jgi:nucleoside-diphosphate-sugar epimerase
LPPGDLQGDWLGGDGHRRPLADIHRTSAHDLTQPSVRLEHQNLCAGPPYLRRLALLARSRGHAQGVPPGESRRVNLAGTRNVFEATVAASRPRRLVYTSSVAAYGYHYENPTPLTEDVPTRGSSEHYYSQQKAQCEALLSEVTIGSDLDVYVLRPCIVAGPKATALADSMPWNQIGERPAELLRAASRVSPLMRPVLPDLGIRQQLAHARWEEVAQLACSAASMSSAIEAEIPSASTEMSGTVS